MSRRAFVKRVATVAGLGGAASYLALAPEGWPLSMRDETGLLSKPTHTPLRLRDFRVERPASGSDVVVGRGGTIRERLLKALEPLGGLQHYVAPGDIAGFLV